MTLQHTFASIFRDEKTAYTLSQFSDNAIKEIEAALFDKNGKAYVKCLVTGKERQAKPEEIVRQLWIHRLIKYYNYPVARLTIEYPITFGRDTSKRADIVVFDKDRLTVPYLIVEVKKIKAKEGKEQLKSYCHATGAPLALWSNGADTIAWHRKNPNYFVEIPELPTVSQTIEDVAGQPWDINMLLKLEKEREEKGNRARSLKTIITDMEDEVLANAGVDVFEEVFKLIFTKLYDELSVFSGRYKHLRFRNTNTASELRDRIQSLFEEASKKWEGVFPVGDRIKLTPDHLQVCIGSLEEYKLFNSNLDVIDEAFEYLVNKSSKGEKGQYFTPRWVIDMCVKMLNPQEDESLIDTACGSAGFTMHAIFKVWRDILDSEGLAASHLFTMEKKPERCYDYVREKVFAIDFDEKSVRVARCLNLIAGDGQTNVLHLNTLDWNKWGETFKEETWQETYFAGWKKMRKLLIDPKGKDFRSFGFDVLMANPPFAGDIKQTDLLSTYELGHKENGKYESKVGRDLLFIERNLDFLKPGGRMAIVLPQGRFNNSSDKRVRQFIAERCRILAVVGLHPSTFKPHTGTKTSVLFVQKWNEDKKVGPLCPKLDDYNIFFATQKLESKDTSGEKIIAIDKEGKQLRDSHGHWIVQHDLFNHEGLTNNGIADAFIEFAKIEKLSFHTGTYDKSCYLEALKRLEISVISLSVVFESDRTGRFDSAYFTKEQISVRKLAATWPKLGNFCRRIVCGPFGSNVLDTNYVDHGIPMLRPFNIRGLRTDAGDIVYLSSEFITRQNLKTFKKDDIAFARVGDVGCGLVVQSEATISPNIIIASINKNELNPYFATAFFNTRYGRLQMEGAIKAVAQPTISTEIIKELRLPIPSLDFQSEIQELLEQSETARRKALSLMERAKRAVEIAVEASEMDAIQFIKSLQES